ncbi:MAG: BamA/TamA family outer membrane protein [Bacteroidota bacterium]
MLSGCLGTKYLKEDEKLLYKQKIKAPKVINTEELSQFYSQRPNRRFPIIPFSPYVGLYYIGQNRYDIDKYEQQKSQIIKKWNTKIEQVGAISKKSQKFRRRKEKKLAKIDKNIEEGNVLMRWGEPITVHDTSATNTTIARFKLYLGSKGYFDNHVVNSTKSRRRKVTSTYEIIPGEPYTIDTLFTQTADSALAILLAKSTSLLQVGRNYDQNTLTEERERIDNLLKDNGYYDFSRQYIVFDVDTAFRGSKKVAIRTSIRQPAKRDYHKVFIVDSVNFQTDANITSLPDSLRTRKAQNGINFSYFNKQYNKKVLSRRVFVKKGELYSKTNTFSTQRQLANLDIFRFINIKYDTSGSKLTANIFTSPLDRYQWSNEVGINVTQGVPGPFYNMAFKKRNFFGGLEIFEINGRIGIEGVAPATDVQDFYRSVEGGVNATLTFPQFVFPISSKLKEKLGRINPKTRLLLGYNYTDRPEYVRENINLSNTYSWQNRKNTQFQFTMTDASIINSTLAADFEDILDSLALQGNRLINTFSPSFVSSMSLGTTWNFNSYGLNFKNSSFLRLFLESGGTSLNLVNTDFLDRESLEFYKFLKFNADFRKVTSLGRNTSLAYRINAGIARPYGDNRILPYEKYFFAGGSNGIRAWRPRRLGPGAYTPLNSAGDRVNYDIEQQGEILLEGSVEIRKNLVGFIDYALFVDFGNVWTIEVDNTRPQANFEADRFYREIAVGTGLGIRFDFSFLILRLDAGLKVYDPARPLGRRFIFDNGFYEAPFTPRASEAVVYNIGIGYPF